MSLFTTMLEHQEPAGNTLSEDLRVWPILKMIILQLRHACVLLEPSIIH